MDRIGRATALAMRGVAGLLAVSLAGAGILQAGLAWAETADQPQTASVRIEVTVEGAELAQAKPKIEYRLDGGDWVVIQDTDDATADLDLEVAAGAEVELRAEAEPIAGGSWAKPKIDPAHFTATANEPTQVKVALSLEPNPPTTTESTPKPAEGISPQASPEPSPLASPEPSPQPSPAPSSEPTTEPAPTPSPSKSARPSLKLGQLGALSSLDASNGTVTVAVTQTSAEADGSRTAPAGTVFNYMVGFGCSTIDGDCLTGGRVAIDLSQWKGYTVTPSATNADVTATNWNPTTGILTLTLADIGTTVASFSWAFAIKTPDVVTATDPRHLSVTATVSGVEFEPVSSHQIESHLTAVHPTPAVQKSAQSNAVFPGEEVVWSISNRFLQTTGIELPTDLSVTDPIPDGLSFVSCTADATYAWSSCQYDTQTNTVTWTWNGTWAGTTSNKRVGTLTTKAADDGALGTYINNTAHITATYADTTLSNADSSASVQLLSPDIYPGANFDKAAAAAGDGAWHRGLGDPAELAPGKFIDPWSPTADSTYYAIGLSAPAAPQVIEAELVDNMPCLDGSTGPMYMSKPTEEGLCQSPAFYLSSVAVNAASEYVPTADWAPLVTIEDGYTFPMLWGGVNQWNQAVYTLPEWAVGRVARLTAPHQAGNGMRLLNDSSYLIVHGYLPDGKGLKKNDLIHNADPVARLWVAGENDPYVTQHGPDAAFEVKGAVQAITKSTCTPDGAAANEVRWCIAANLKAASTATPFLRGDVVISDLWPSEVPIPADMTNPIQPIDRNTWWGINYWATPTITENFAAGQDLIQWRIPAAAIETYRANYAGAGGTPQSVINLWLQLPTATLPHSGEFTNTAVIQMSELDNPNADFDWGNREPDTLNLDHNSKTGWLVSSSVTTRLDPTPGSFGFGLTKAVKGDLDPAFRVNPAKAYLTPGTGSATYRLTWTNRNSVELKNSVMYDLLPRIGDHGALADNAGEARGSDFPVRFVSAATPAAAGVVPEYSTQLNPCREEIYPNNPGCVDDWSTTPPADLSDVTALRWKNPSTYGFGQGWSVEFTVGAPAGLDLSQVAWNTVAAQAYRADTSDALTAVEAPKVGIQSGWVGDAVWSKVDSSGALLANAVWLLTAVDGDDVPLPGSAGDSQTVTDCVAAPCAGLDVDPTAGKYRVENLTADTRYRLVETVAPAGYILVPTHYLQTSKRVADWSFGDIDNEPYYTLTLTKRIRIDGVTLDPASSHPINDLPFPVRYRLIPPSPQLPQDWVDQTISNGTAFTVTDIPSGWRVEILEQTGRPQPSVYWSEPTLAVGGTSMTRDLSGSWTVEVTDATDVVLTNNAISINPVDLPLAGGTGTAGWVFGVLTAIGFTAITTVALRRGRRVRDA